MPIVFLPPGFISHDWLRSTVWRTLCATLNDDRALAY
jgi:hypothetical protein